MSNYVLKSVFQDLLIPSVALPENIFNVQFDKYLFFDMDLSSSKSLIKIVQEIVVNNLQPNAAAKAFSASEGVLMGELDGTENWENKIAVWVKILRDHGDHHGIVLMGASGGWIAYQARPVDIGVFAFNYREGSTYSIDRWREYFFDRSVIFNWISNNSMHEASMIAGIEREYLSALLNNFHDRVLLDLEPPTEDQVSETK